MNILIITHSYEPALTPRAFRWTALADKFAALGHAVDVVCAKSTMEAQVNAQQNPAVFYVRDLFQFRSRFKSKFQPRQSAPEKQGQVKCAVARHSLSRLLKNCLRSFGRFFYWPDYAFGWILPAWRVAKKLCAQKNYALVITVSHPFSGHVVGLLLRKQLLGKKWLVDVGDPFCLMKNPAPNNFWLYGWLNHWAEKAVLKRSSVIAVTTYATQAMYAQAFPIFEKKIAVIPPLFTLPIHECQMGCKTAARNDQIFKLVFVGTLYSKLRSPQYLLKLFERLVVKSKRRFELHIYGSVNDCASILLPYQNVLGSQLSVHGLVDRLTVTQAMLDANMLINIGNNSLVQLASKVIEYMALGKPILNLTTLENDTSMLELSEYPESLTVRDDGAPIADDTVDKVINFFDAAKPASAATIAGIRQTYAIDKIAQAYLNLAQEIV